MFEWDDLKHFLAVARHGSTTAAGRAMKVDQSTVQRRLAELERHISQPLVERRATGYRLTAYGQELRPHAERVEQQVLSLQRFVPSLSRALNGVIRLTCPEPIVLRISKSDLLQRLHTRHPGLHVEFVMSDRYVDLAKGEADVALRSGDTVDNQLIGRKIADSLWAVYGGREYLAQHGSPKHLEDLAQHAWIGFDETMANLRATALGDAEPDLVRVLGPVTELTRSWRMLTTRQLRRTPRVSAFFEFMAEELATLRPILTG